VIRLRLERRAGKAVTVLAADGVDPEALRDLARELRAACAAGGGVKGPEATLQGDHRERVRALLLGRGMQVKG
jgi:translation initiation factor 1